MGSTKKINHTPIPFQTSSLLDRLAQTGQSQHYCTLILDDPNVPEEAKSKARETYGKLQEISEIIQDKIAVLRTFKREDGTQCFSTTEKD